MNSRHTSSVPKNVVFLRLRYCDSRCSQTCRRRCQTSRRRSQTWRSCSQTCCGRSQTCRRRSQTCNRRSQVFPGAPKVLSGAPRCSQTYHNHSHGTPVPVIRDLRDSKGRPECPRMVWYSLEIDTSKFTLHILSDTPGDFQRLKYILLMLGHAERRVLHSAHCHSTSSCPSSWSHTAYICTVHGSQMGSRYCFVGSSQGNHEHRISITQQGITQQSAGTGVCFFPRWRRWRWLRLRVWDVFNVFEVVNTVQVLDWIIGRVDFTTLGGFNASGCTTNSQILLVCNLKVLRIVWFDTFKSPAVWGELLSACKFRTTEWGLLWYCWRHARSGVYTGEKDKHWCWAWAAWCGFKLMILSANLRDILSLNTITRRYLTCQELQIHCIHNVPYYYEQSIANTKPIHEINPEQSKNLAMHVIINAWDTSIQTKETNKTKTRP